MLGEHQRRWIEGERCSMVGVMVVEVVSSVRRCKRLWRGALWLFGVLLLVLVSGCGGGSKVQVLDSPPGAENRVGGEDNAGDSTSTAPGNSHPSTGPEPEAPSDPFDDPGPGPEPEGSSDPVGDTGGGGEDDGPGVGPGLGDLAGGLRLVPPPPPYEALADEIFDMCDDADAFAVLYGRVLGPGEEMTLEEFDAIALDRWINEVTCAEPGGRRYVYMSAFSPGGPFATVQGAIDDHNDRNQYADENAIIRPRDVPLGYYGVLDWTFTLEDIDEIKVMPDSVLVRDGVVRGLVRNFSKTLFGREVTVTVSAADRKESVNNDAQPASGRFPLTVQPGERAFFEIEGWTGSTDPADFVLEVTADMSTEVDITRSFGFGYGGTVVSRAVDEEFLKGYVPDFVYQHEKHKIPEDGRFDIDVVSVGLMAPTSHPSLKDQILNQTIEDLRVYMMLGGAHGVVDIIEPPLFIPAFSAGHPHNYPQVVSIPTHYREAPFWDFQIVFIRDHAWHIWVGQPGPLDYNPRTLPDPPETTTTTSTP